MQCATAHMRLLKEKVLRTTESEWAAARNAEAIVRDSHAVVPVSVSLSGEYGLDGLCLSIPTIIGNKGAEQVLEINLSDGEMEKLKKSAEELKTVLAQIEA